jgi:hypothetical protein
MRLVPHTSVTVWDDDKLQKLKRYNVEADRCVPLSIVFY